MRCALDVGMLLVMSLALSFSTPVTDTGTIRGLVVDDKGVPLSDVRVEAAPDGPLSYVLPNTLTDANGAFHFDGLRWGNYTLFTTKESAGYPNNGFGFYTTKAAPRVELIAQAPSANVRMEMGPKGGTLSGVVTDAATGLPVGSRFMLAAPSVRCIVTAVHRRLSGGLGPRLQDMVLRRAERRPEPISAQAAARGEKTARHTFGT